MRNQDQSSRVLRWGAALFLMVAAVLPALASAHKSEAWARSQFETAEKMRSALTDEPAGDRSRHDYQQVIDAYRRVYFGAPASTKADPSAAATAELLVEMGRRFEDDAILRKAIRQYEFLRREYPGSKARVEALFTIAQVYGDDLGDSARAKSTFQQFLQLYPRNHLADQARQALAQEPGPRRQQNLDAQVGPPNNATEKIAPNVHALPLVTGIQHWSMPNYTRVAIDFDQAGLEKTGLYDGHDNGNHDNGSPDNGNTDLQQADPEKAEVQQGDPAQRVKFESQHLRHPNRIYFDLADTRLSHGLNGKSFAVDDSFLKQIRTAQFKQGRTRVVLEVEEHSVYNAFLAANPPRLIIDIRKDAVENNGGETQSTGGVAESKMSGGRDGQGDDLPVATAAVQTRKPFGGPGAAPPATATVPGRSANLPAIKKTIVEADDDADDVVVTTAETKTASKSPMIPAAERSQIRPVRSVHEAQPTANGERSLIRTLGLKIGKIVIDPGHGGHDAGTIGPNGLTEKDLVLDVSLRLGKLLESRLGAEVDYTRDDDTFIPLETRTEIANQDQADLFVSVHANSSHDSDARGVETYYLNFTTSRDALDVAARENAVSDQSIYALQDLVKKIALKEKIEESREFASDVQSALHSGLAAKNPGLRDRGVRRAPFIVLIGANMPSILAEISFVSNPEDERKLKTPEYRQRVAESLYRGIAKYVNGLSGVRVASKIDKNSGQ